LHSTKEEICTSTIQPRERHGGVAEDEKQAPVAQDAVSGAGFSVFSEVAGTDQMNSVHRTDSSRSKAPALERRVLEAPASRDHPVEAGASGAVSSEAGASEPEHLAVAQNRGQMAGHIGAAGSFIGSPR